MIPAIFLAWRYWSGISYLRCSMCLFCSLFWLQFDIFESPDTLVEFWKTHTMERYRLQLTCVHLPWKSEGVLQICTNVSPKPNCDQPWANPGSASSLADSEFTLSAPSKYLCLNISPYNEIIAFWYLPWVRVTSRGQFSIVLFFGDSLDPNFIFVDFIFNLFVFLFGHFDKSNTSF